MNNKINWNLSDFYNSVSDPKIEKDKKEILFLTENFNKIYKNKINSPKITSTLFLKSLLDYQNIIEKTAIIEIYASLIFSTDSISNISKNLYQSSSEFGTQINANILWYQLEIINLDDKLFKKLLNDKKIKNFTHFLTTLRIMKPFTLSENEEKIMTQKSQTSSQAFVRLYDQTQSTEKFELKIKDKNKTLTISEIQSIMSNNPDRKLRENATISYSKTFSKNSNLYSFILNTLILDKKISDEIRGFKYPQEATFISYEVNQKIVENMSKAILERQKLVEKYYLLKKKLLKLSQLYEWDRYSNIYNIDEKTYSWDEAKEIILSSFKNFDEEFYQIAKMFFEKNWIDAEVKNGKRGGAFCMYATPSKHPLVFVNFTGKLNDITTLAHELGHAIHAYLSKNNNYLEFNPSTATAEIASTFAESLVFEKIFNDLKEQKLKVNLLAAKIQNGFATVFRQNDFYIFENELHKLRREKGELTIDEIGNLYQKTLQKSFGKGLTLSDYHENLWMPILHFYHYNFYVFTYCFGDLLALSLFNLYKIGKKDFVKNYKKALSQGGSQDPKNILKIIGLNIEDKDFWKNGLNLIEKEVNDLIKLIN
ncbi:MAG TPA: M3 family oligoendopeptidase [Patescibacteria group bacterium]|nr:M3 family oligoendopeptidase [Patescibacteria group bacterium]